MFNQLLVMQLNAALTKRSGYSAFGLKFRNAPRLHRELYLTFCKLLPRPFGVLALLA